MVKVQAGEFVYHSVEPAEKTGKAVILYHGWGSAAESWLPYAEVMAQQGHHAIVPEIIYNDSRKPLENPFEIEVVHMYFWKAITESIEEFGAFREVLDVPESDIVLIGSSMGGFIASGIFACYTNISGLASINGSGAFVKTENIFRERQEFSPVKGEAEMRLKKFDPLERKTGQGKVLLLNGELDRTVPLEGHAAYYRHFIETNGDQNIEHKVYKRAGHQFTREMERDVESWLARISGQREVSKKEFL